jgi:spermidine/putrescine transport system substrate-binding protein
VVGESISIAMDFRQQAFYPLRFRILAGLSMKNNKLILFLGIIFAPFLQAQTLTIVNWEDYLSPKVIQRWEEKTGVRIKQIYFDNDEQRDAMLTSHDENTIDIVVIDEVISRAYGEKKILVDPAKSSELSNLKHIDSFWRKQCSKYSIPYMWGTIGIAYRKDKIEKVPDSWWDILRPEESLRGHISLLKDAMDTFIPPLIVRGHSSNTGSVDELKQAFIDLSDLLPHVMTFIYPITYIGTHPDDSNLYMSMVYSGDQYALNKIQNSDHWEYVIPKEGTLVWTDCMAVLRSSRNPELAFKFINFIGRPEIAALNSEELHEASPNLAAKKLQSPEFVANARVYPDKALIKNSHYYQELDIDNLRLRNRIVQSLMVKYETQ